MLTVYQVTQRIPGDPLGERDIDRGFFGDQALARDYCEAAPDGLRVASQRTWNASQNGALTLGGFTVTPTRVYTSMNEAPTRPKTLAPAIPWGS